jgi:hypothetical protein
MVQRRVFRAMLVALVLAPTCGGIRRDEFVCEEAFAKLSECCPGFSTAEDYCDYDSGCGATRHPALSPEESDCIRGKTCAALRDQKICERAAQVKPPVEEDDAGQVSPSWSQRGGVCP